MNQDLVNELVQVTNHVSAWPGEIQAAIIKAYAVIRSAEIVAVSKQSANGAAGYSPYRTCGYAPPGGGYKISL